jgi:hypothetical protein
MTSSSPYRIPAPPAKAPLAHGSGLTPGVLLFVVIVAGAILYCFRDPSPSPMSTETDWAYSTHVRVAHGRR